ncbi:MAG: hypothetical protein ACJ709_05775, partial [Nitrososphaeraceae archaeon]
ADSDFHHHDVDDDPEEYLLQLKFTYNGPTEAGTPGSEYCAGYQQGLQMIIQCFLITRLSSFFPFVFSIRS